MIKSIQTGSILFGATHTSRTATITAVDVNKSLIFLLGFSILAQCAREALCRVELTNSTTVTAIRIAGIADAAGYLNFMVVEWDSGVAQVQRGTHTISPGTGTWTLAIPSVNLAKTILAYCGSTSNSGAGWPIVEQSTLILNSATELGGYRAGTPNTTVVGYNLIEFS